MGRKWIVLFGTCLCLVLALSIYPPALSARERVALVIGNCAYTEESPLKQPANDAKAMAALLRQQGFFVLELVDGDRHEMIRDLEALKRLIEKNTVVLFYYSGVAINYDGESYLVPAKAALQRVSDIPYQCLPLKEFITAVTANGESTGLVILDAAGPSIWAQNFEKVSSGIAPISAPRGMLIAASAAPGTIAEKVSGDNSIFTANLMRHMTEPGQDIQEIIKRTRHSVFKATGGRQTPWSTSSLTKPFYFSDRGTTAGPMSPAYPQSSPSPKAASSAPSGSTDWQAQEKAIMERRLQEARARQAEKQRRRRLAQKSKATEARVEKSETMAEIGKSKVETPEPTPVESPEPTAAEPEPAAAESPMPPPPPAPAPVPPPPPKAVSPKLITSAKSMVQAEEVPRLAAEEPMPEAAEAPAPSPEPSAVERYPTMECPDQVKVDQEFALMVSLTEDQITPDVQIKSGQATPDGALSLQLPKSSKGWTIDVVLSAPGFTFVKGSNNGAVQLPPAGDSTPALFHLKARQPKKPGKGENIYATFWHDGTFLAKVSKTISVTDPSAPKVATRSAKAETSTATAPSSDTAPSPSAPAPAPMAVHAVQATRPAPIGPVLEQVDLTIYVLENLDPDKPYQSEIIIASPWLQPTLQKYQTPAQADEWLQFHYDKFVKSLVKLVQAQSSDMGSEAAKTARMKTQALMEGFGDELYQKFAPEPLKTAFWHLVDRLGPEFDTIQIFSNNPVIPWELMRPSRPDGSETRGFLGIEFTIGRWHVSHHSRQLDRPPQSLAVEELVVVAPGYKEGESLPGQSEEMKMLAGFTGFRSTPGKLESVEKLLSSSPNGIIHFAGHGSAKPSAGGVYEYFITLEDTALDLTTFRGLAGTGAFLRNPFFFFNACEMGRSKKVADFVGGWAPAVLESGASGFIGALWPVDDRGAAKFAALFYSELDQRLAKGPVNVAELLRDARRLYLEEGNPTYLAFIYYGDPNLKFSRPKL